MRIFIKRTAPLIYFLAVSLPHHPFSDWLDKNILTPYGVAFVQNASDIVSAVLAIVVLSLVIFIVHNHRSLIWQHCTIWFVSIALTVIADRFLIVNNIERIHFPQYTMLVLFLGLSLRSELLIFSVASFAGFFDEFLQYLMNPNRTNYLDFNDIVLNMLGAGIGIAILMGVRKPLLEKIPKYEKKFRIVFVTILLTFVCFVGAALVLDRFVLFANQVKPRNVFSIIDGKLSFIMSFERHDQFWQHSPAHGKAFHVLSPFEGLSIIFLLSAFTMWWTRWLKNNVNL